MGIVDISKLKLVPICELSAGSLCRFRVTGPVVVVRFGEPDERGRIRIVWLNDGKDGTSSATIPVIQVQATFQNETLE